MGLGELILVAFGERNLYLSHNPKITFFKKVYKKHSNFAIESIPQYLKVTPNFGKKVTVLVASSSENLFLSSRNIPNIYLVEATSASTYDLLDCEKLLFDKAGLVLLNKNLMVTS